jgi:hypothetical protein
MAQADQSNSMKMIQDRMNLENIIGARPVNNGMVQDSSAPQQVGSPSTPQSSVESGSQMSTEPNATPANFSPLNTSTLSQLRDQAAPAASPQPAGPIMRKADKSRMVTIPYINGQKLDYELPTPEEQVQRQAQLAENAKVREKMGMEKANVQAAEVFGAPVSDDIAKTLGLPQGFKVLRNELPGLADKAAQLRKSNADVSKSEAELPGVKAESAMKVAESNAMQNLTPENLAGMVKGSIDQTKYPDQYQRTLNDANNAMRLGLGVKGVQAAIKDGSDKVAQRENVIAQANATSVPFREAALQNQQFQRTEQSYRFHAAELDKLAAPVTQLNQRISRLNDTISQGTPQADALVAPELLSVMSGGQGSGLRMNESEISRIVGGRSKWESLKAAMNQWSLDPKQANSITPEQRTEIHALVDEVTKRSMAQQSIIGDARSQLAGATGPEQHKVILANAQNKLSSVYAPTTKLKAPDGTIQDVPTDQVDHYLKLGAQRVGQ